jgi:hypothetical protein
VESLGFGSAAACEAGRLGQRLVRDKMGFPHPSRLGEARQKGLKLVAPANDNTLVAGRAGPLLPDLGWL